jgi:nitrate reductase gamma subunit
LNIGFSLFVVFALILIAFIGAGQAGWQALFGLWIPYGALLVFLGGVVYRVVRWAKTPVPFRIPTSCGQQSSLPWIRSGFFENPHNTWGVIGRMALEILFFRSLFRNTKVSLQNQRPVYGGAKWLWLAGLTFHWSFFVIVTRHLRFFTEPVPLPINLLAALDGLFEISVPTLYLTDAAVILAITYLFLRRVAIPQLRYISLAADYFPLILILGIAVSGFLMRHISKVDLQKVKELSLGWFAFQPVVPEGIGVIFYIHLFLVCSLLVYFPFSKLMHLGGVFFSPTRNLSNNNRSRRHINPWNYRVQVHTYEEYEDEFRDRMKEAGIPVEKE